MRKVGKLVRNYLMVATLISGIAMTAQVAFGQDSVMESSLVMGKYVQREFESFLKSPTTQTAVNKPVSNPTSVMGSDLVMGKYVQREFESFLKSPTTPSVASTPSMQVPASVMESNMIMGKYVQREFESFLKPTSKTTKESIAGKEFSAPKEITIVPESTK
jgi:hypothetical protein